MMNKYETKMLHFKGGPKDKTYDSHDQVSGQTISAKAGDNIEVSEAKAEQLLADFPHLFQVAGAAPTKAKEKEPAHHDTKVKKK